MTNLELLATVALCVFICWGAVDITWKVNLIIEMYERRQILRRGRDAVRHAHDVWDDTE